MTAFAKTPLSVRVWTFNIREALQKPLTLSKCQLVITESCLHWHIIMSKCQMSKWQPSNIYGKANEYFFSVQWTYTKYLMFYMTLKQIGLNIKSISTSFY